MRDGEGSERTRLSVPYNYVGSRQITISPVYFCRCVRTCVCNALCVRRCARMSVCVCVKDEHLLFEVLFFCLRVLVCMLGLILM